MVVEIPTLTLVSPKNIVDTHEVSRIDIPRINIKGDMIMTMTRGNPMMMASGAGIPSMVSAILEDLIVEEKRKEGFSCL